MADCACVYIDTDYQPSLYNAKEVTAKKDHKCCECNRIINPGEKYEYVFGVWDGISGVFKTCCDCLSLRNVLFCNGFEHEGLYEELSQFLCDTDLDIELGFLNSLTVRARSKVVELIDGYMEDYDE